MPISELVRERGRVEGVSTYGLCYVVDNNSAMSITIVHGRQRFVSFLTSGIPYFELDSCILIECDGLGEEGSANCRFAVIIELVLDKPQNQ